MAGIGTILGILFGLGAVFAAFTQRPPDVTVGGAILISVGVGVVVFVAGLLLPMLVGTAAMGAVIGWVIAGIVYAIQTQWSAMVLSFGCAVTVLVAQMLFGAIRGGRQNALY